jgi:hypothetical protein
VINRFMVQGKWLTMLFYGSTTYPGHTV